VTLERLGLRLVIFVDDLDRLEKSAPNAQQAIAQALNQLQNVSNIQYVVAIGPTLTSLVDDKIVTLDLLNLHVTKSWSKNRPGICSHTCMESEKGGS